MDIVFSCTATGLDALVPASSGADACARVRAEIEKAIEAPLRPGERPSVDHAGRWIDVALSIRRGTVKAELSDRLDGTLRRHPALFHSTLDRAPGPGAVDALARAIAAALLPGRAARETDSTHVSA